MDNGQLIIDNYLIRFKTALLQFVKATQLTIAIELKIEIVTTIKL